MKSIRYICFLFIAAAVVFDVAASAQASYHVVKRATLGGEGGWDYLTVDPDARRIYITRGSHVMVVDADSLKPVGDIPDTAGVHGVALAPEMGKGFTSNGGANTVTVFDLKTLKATGQVKVGERPDAILYDAASKRVFTFNARSQDTTAVDASAGTVAGTIALGGKPEFAAADGEGHVFVNIEDKGEIVQFDAKQLKVMNRWPMQGCEEPSGLALDRKHKRLFSVCGNKVMAIVDASSGKLITTLPTGAGTDGAAFDPDALLAFSSNGGSGTITIVHEDSPDKFKVVQNADTVRGARTVTFDPKTHNVITVSAQFEPAAPAAEGQPRQRPKMVPGTFEVLVVGK